MSARSKLAHAISSLEDAQRRLVRLRNDYDEARPDVNRAIRDLEDAIDEIRRVRRHLDE